MLPQLRNKRILDPLLNFQELSGSNLEGQTKWQKVRRKRKGVQAISNSDKTGENGKKQDSVHPP